MWDGERRAREAATSGPQIFARAENGKEPLPTQRSWLQGKTDFPKIARIPNYRLSSNILTPTHLGHFLVPTSSLIP